MLFPADATPFTEHYPPSADQFVDSANCRGKPLAMAELSERLDDYERRLSIMQEELRELRRLAQAHEAVPAAPPSGLPRRQVPVAPPPLTSPPPPEPPAVTLPPSEPSEPFDFSVLLGARALAWTGGAVTLLGIVFFFVLAAERGWIGHGARLALGAVASTLLVGAGAWLRRRHGDTYASVSAFGAGIAGFYATLLAASVLYHLVASPLALACAGGVAALGGAVALAWRSETLAGLGLVGAMLVPVAIAVQAGHLSALGTAFAGAVLAAATLVAVRSDWRGLLLVSFLVTAPQVIAIEFDHHAYATELAIAFWLVYAAGSLWLALRTRLTYLPASLLALSATFGGWSAAFLFDGRTQGIALLAVAGTYAAASSVLFVRDRDTASVLWAISLTVAAVGAASLTSGTTLTFVWAAESAALAWLAKRIAEPRFQLAALGWLGLAFAHGISVDAPLAKLFAENGDAWRAAPSAAALAAATAAVGLCTFDWEPRSEGILARVFEDLRSQQPTLRIVAFALAGAAAIYSASLAVVVLPSSWDRGHVAVAGLWTLIAVCVALTRLRVSSLVVAGAALLLVVFYDLPQLAEVERSWAFAIVAAGTLVVSILFDLASERQLEVPSVVGLVCSVGLASAAAAGLFEGHALGAALLGCGALYAACGVAVLHRRREFASGLGIAGLALAAVATPLLLDGTWVVLAWAAAAIALTQLARYEERLFYAAATFLGLAFVHTILFEAQPSDVFVAHRHPGAGAPAVVLVLIAGAVIAWANEETRRVLTWLSGVLALYAVTLAVLETSETIGGGIDTAFQRGHTAVSAVWGAVGLALLIVGLKRARRELQWGGFALFGVALAKLFVYDLAFLSSVARAFSFIAVGALLVTGGFFYQRLAVQSKV